MIELTARKLINSGFLDLYKKLLLGLDIDEEEKIKVLAVAVVLINQVDDNLNNLGYRIALAYGNKIRDYRPLYDLSVRKGLMPVASVIRPRSGDQEESFFVDFFDSYTEIYRKGSIVLTEQQYILNKFFEDNIRRTVSVVAPTSYGKSELIMSVLKGGGPCKACIVVPSKSLLSQTKKRLIDADIEWVSKIITHPDMYKENDDSCIFVVTQERLSRALHEHRDLSFDMVFVDEAHNILDDDERNVLLASVLCVASSRNPDTAFKFLTPFLMNHENLHLRHSSYRVENYKISEYIKSERMYLSDFRRGKRSHKLYDQFTNRYLEYADDSTDYIDLIKNKSLSKNIIYFNRPKNIESFCLDFIGGMNDVECEVVASACEEIMAYTSEHYRLVKCLKKGVIYHHGSIPDVIKSYIENVFIRSSAIKYVVTSSTLLEGVNLPVERLFMLENKKGIRLLSPSQLKNLIGRVGRFSEVFGDPENQRLDLLEPSIYLVGTDKYSKRGDLEGFLERSLNVSREVVDYPVNTLLENTEISEANQSELDRAEERLENLEPGTIEGYDKQYTQTVIGELLFTNNATEINIFERESSIQNGLDAHINQHGLIGDPDTTIHIIVNYFLVYSTNDQLSRLREERAQRFYSMFLEWKVKNVPFKQMVARMVGYWEQMDPESDALVFVGKWGDEKLGDSHFEYWTDITSKEIDEKINLAIVRIKEEDDFFDYSIFRFIDVLNDAGMMEPEFYLRLKYGTTDDVRIRLIREGFSRSLSELIVKRYRESLAVDDDGDVTVNSNLLQKMRLNEESEMLIFEASLNVKA
jgi:hypothetical protein